MTTRQLISATTVACACALMADGVPEAGNVSMTQDPFSREVTITYTLTNAPAVVTLDIQTNGPNGWVSIGGEHIDCFSQDSDVWKKVSGKETYTIKWNPDQSWPSNKVTMADGGVKAVVTAWALRAIFPEWDFSHHLGKFAWWKEIVLAVLLALASISGDLTESALKRKCGVKDSGTLIPGMGGPLDVLDSFIYVGPVCLIFSEIVRRF